MCKRPLEWIRGNAESCCCIFMPHRSTMYVDAAYCYRPSSVVCLSVCHTSEPCKNGSTDRDFVWVEDSGGPREPCITWATGVQIPPWEGKIFRGNGESHCKVWGHSAVICAKTAEPNQMPFGIWAGIDHRSHVLDGVQRC